MWTGDDFERSSEDLDQYLQGTYNRVAEDMGWMKIAEWAKLIKEFPDRSSYVANSFSPLARSGLVQKLTDTNRIPASPESNSDEVNLSGTLWAHQLRNHMADRVLLRVLDEMPQLATRLLVRNTALYGRYDRFTAEAAFRINVSIPLVFLIMSVT